MIYRIYGSTNKSVSLIGMGTSRFNPGKSAFSGNVDLVLRAVELGINYFDTAPTYASGASEKILGEAFRQTRTDRDIFVATKSMLSMDPAADDVLKRIDMSLKTLHIKKIAFFHMWSILNLDGYKKITAKRGPLDGAIKAKEQGLVEHICFSAHCGGGEIAQILNDGFFDGVTLGFNAINFKFRLAGLRKAHEMGLGVAIMNPLGGGLIPQNPERFNFLQSSGRGGIAGSAIQFVASHKEVTTVLIGVSCERDLLEAEKVISENTLYTQAELQKLYESAAICMDNNLCTSCGYCDGCPAELPIDKLMQLYNEYILSDGDLAHYHLMCMERFRIKPIQSFGCVKCGKCEKKCTQHLPIIERIERMNAMSAREKEKWKAIADKTLIRDGVKTGIYGISFEAEYLIQSYLDVYGSIDFPLLFFDSNSAKWGKRFMDTGYVIQSPKEIVESGVERIVITAKKYSNEITAYLREFIPANIEIMSI